MGTKIFLFASLFLLFSPASLRASDQTSAYRITLTSGPVAVLPKGAAKASPAVVNFPLEEGDRVITGREAKVELATKEGSVIELDQNSDMEVETFSEKLERFFLRAGGFLSRLKKQLEKKAKPRYQIRTPVAVASVRGTDLALFLDEEGKLQAGVLDGEVSVQAEGEEEIILNDRQRGVLIEKGKPPVPMIDIPPLVVRRRVWFQHVRDRVPAIRKEWNKVDRAHLRRLRARSLKRHINWVPPRRAVPKKVKPRRVRPGKRTRRRLRR